MNIKDYTFFNPYDQNEAKESFLCEIHSALPTFYIRRGLFFFFQEKFYFPTSEWEEASLPSLSMVYRLRDGLIEIGLKNASEKEEETLYQEKVHVSL